ncbi:hypothetical protein [Clostridium cylindrosporum]|uniref:Prenylated flavin chaperone LpdD-like domain-containing protein n=1 Tax=Clostridium cylindrosporum DSM 605 TaxID=1121307 RepID=A0A0J8DA06_CLOCY|nr:hypothetical protein [Clostridium cylindrosporum]KMT22890.1 hypothetical protein CLCY_5c01290 [Clostridium cylindrosporum DSM 605]
MNSIRERVGTGKYVVEGFAIWCGEALNITIGGGEKYHIGAVGIAIPSSLKGENKRSATTSVLCIQEHKEDEYARYAAKHLATALDCVVTVSIGIHIDDVSKEDIEVLSNNFKEIIDKFEKSLSSRTKSKSSLSYF